MKNAWQKIALGSAALASMLFAMPALAASLSCVREGDDVNCDYDATGYTPLFSLYSIQDNVSVEKSSNETGTFHAVGYCADHYDAQNQRFQLRENATIGDGDPICSGDCLPYVSSGVDCSIVTTCGNGIIEGTHGQESCDDGNTSDGDGCNSECGIEVNWSCSGEPSVCTPTGGGGGTLNFTPAVNGLGTATGDALWFIIWLMLKVLGAVLIVAGVYRGFRALQKYFGLSVVDGGKAGDHAARVAATRYAVAKKYGRKGGGTRGHPRRVFPGHGHLISTAGQRQREAAFRAGHGGMSRRQWRKFKRQHPHPSGRHYNSIHM